MKKEQPPTKESEAKKMKPFFLERLSEQNLVIIMLIIFLGLLLICVIIYTGYDVGCQVDTNSTAWVDRCFRK